MASQRYTKEFKAEAIKLAMGSDKTVVEVARLLGISHKSLYLWLQAGRDDGMRTAETSLKDGAIRWERDLKTHADGAEVLEHYLMLKCSEESPQVTAKATLQLRLPERFWRRTPKAKSGT
jgi:transposase-like protein